jgi:hypothetical protein
MGLMVSLAQARLLKCLPQEGIFGVALWEIRGGCLHWFRRGTGDGGRLVT